MNNFDKLIIVISSKIKISNFSSIGQTISSKQFTLLQLHVPLCVCLKGLAMIFAGQKTPFIIFRSKEIYFIFQNK